MYWWLPTRLAVCMIWDFCVRELLYHIHLFEQKHKGFGQVCSYDHRNTWICAPQWTNNWLPRNNRHLFWSGRVGLFEKNHLVFPWRVQHHLGSTYRNLNLVPSTAHIETEKRSPAPKYENKDTEQQLIYKWKISARFCCAIVWIESTPLRELFFSRMFCPGCVLSMLRFVIPCGIVMPNCGEYFCPVCSWIAVPRQRRRLPPHMWEGRGSEAWWSCPCLTRRNV